MSWDPPFTLPGLTVQYIISVGTEQYELNSTNYTYCPLNLTNGEYIFNITTSNGAGNGSTSDLTVAFESSMDCSLFSMFIDRLCRCCCSWSEYTSHWEQLDIKFSFKSKVQLFS